MLRMCVAMTVPSLCLLTHVPVVRGAPPTTWPTSRGAATAAPSGGVFDELRRAWYAGGQQGTPRPEAIARVSAYYGAHPADPDAQWWMAVLQKQGLAQSGKSTNELLAGAAMGGQTIAVARLGKSLLVGDGEKADPERGLRMLRDTLAKGESEAAIELGRAYLNGTGVSVDPAQAEQLFRQAIELGDARGHYLLAEWFGRVKHDRTSQLAELDLAARGGNTDAMVNLVEAYRDGRGGITMNPKQALFWMEKGARLGRVSLQRDLAKALIDQYGGVILTSQNRQAARVLLETAVKSNDVEAMRVLAEQYLTAELGYDYEPDKALDLLKRAYDLGDLPAMLELGKLHIEGIVVPRDVARGTQLVRLAADGGYEPAKRYYVRLASPPPATPTTQRSR